MKRKWSKSRKFLTIAALVLGLFMAIYTLLATEVIPFDPELIGIMDVIVTDHHGDDPTLHYYNIGMGRLKQPCDPFEPQEMTVYTVDRYGLESYIDQEKNKVLNRLLYIRIEDDQGREITPTPLLEAVVTQAATLEHDIMELTIFQAGGETFLQTELNVNWWCPVELYWFNMETGKLVELYTFDGLEVVGLRLRDVTRAR